MSRGFRGIKLTDHPFSRERSIQLLSLPSWRRTGVGRAHKHNKPQQKVGANVSIILGHFQKCLTEEILRIHQQGAIHFLSYI